MVERSDSHHEQRRWVSLRSTHPATPTCPTGKSPVSCPAPSKKIFLLAADPTQIYIPRRPVPLRGALANVTDAGRDAVDAAALGVKRDGRAGFGLSQTRERSTARRRTVLLRTVKPCGSGTRCWCQVGG